MRPRSILKVAVIVLAAASASVAAARGPSERFRLEGGLEPLSGFVENRGIWPDEVLFFGRAGGIEATLLADALAFRPVVDPEEQRPAAPLWIRLPGVGAAEGEAPFATRHHFFLGAKTATHARGFARVVYHDVQPGVDVVVRRETAGFAYDLHLAPGADLSGFVLEIEGASGAELADDGRTLALNTSSGRVEQRIGAAWQADSEGGAREAVESRFRVIESDVGVVRVGFEAPGRDASRAFVLDPTLVWSTYVGGPSQEVLRQFDVGADGAVYLTCRAWIGAPVTHGAFQTTVGGGFAEAWVGKLSADGTSLEWGTYLGGADADDPFGVAEDADGTVVVLGRTWSGAFPTTPGVVQPQPVSTPVNADLFVTRLAPDGASLVWSTFYGGPGAEFDPVMAMFPDGDVLIVARPAASLPPATPGAFDTVHDVGDYLIARLSADGTQVLWQTYFRTSLVAEIEIASDGNICFGGNIAPSDGPLPATPGAYKVTSPSIHTTGYVAKLASDGASLLFATYLGGDANLDAVWGLAVDAASAIYVAGQNNSSDFPVTPGAFFSPGIGTNGFVTKLLPNGTGLVWSSVYGACCVGGAGLLWDLDVDTAGNVYAVGFANVPGLPTTPDALQPNFIGPTPGGDAYLSKFDAFGEALEYSSWFGGNGGDFQPLVVLDAAQDLVLGMGTTSSNLPVTPGAYDTFAGGSDDVGLAKFDFELHPWTVMAGGLKGAADVPNLAGDGLLVAGTPARISVRGARPLAPGLLLLGTSELNLQLFGGTVVPSPDLVLAVATNASGGFDVPFVWPPNVPAGARFLLQVWIADPGAAKGWSATNALRMEAR